MASLGLTWPLPKSSGAVVIIADRIAAGVQSRCTDRSSAATPATCGDAMDVPETSAYLVKSFFSPISMISLLGTHAARMSTPGATTSGFKIVGLICPGPRAEK
nr:unnamed protein product [Digitaria exilis]